MAEFPIDCENSSYKSFDYCYFPTLVNHLPTPPCLRGILLYAKALGPQQITTNQFDAMGFIFKQSYIFSKSNPETKNADYAAVVGIFYLSDERGLNKRKCS